MFRENELEGIVGKENCLREELLSAHTTFRIGGPARYFVTPQDTEELAAVTAYVRREKMPYFIMGNGSNLLVCDTGFDGVVINTSCAGKGERRTEKLPLDAVLQVDREELLKRGFLHEAECSALEKENREAFAPGRRCYVAGSGIMLSVLANKLAKDGAAGFEFAGGIPGTLGGAVAMNAGAYGGEIKDSILGAKALLPDGTRRFYTKQELALSYRSSIIQTEELIVLWALFSFAEGDRDKSMEKMQELNRRRREKQPLEYGSAGSTFKRPEGHFAGQLIEEAGLKGYRVGDVMVSEKHAGFIVNVGEGTYDDARQVIGHVKKTVLERFGVQLECEVRVLGEEKL